MYMLLGLIVISITNPTLSFSYNTNKGSLTNAVNSNYRSMPYGARTKFPTLHTSIHRTPFSDTISLTRNLSQDGRKSHLLPLSSTSTSNDAIGSAKISKKERTLGALVLLSVPLAWGTYSPIVKYVYEMDPPVPGFVFSAIYYVIATATLWGLVVVNDLQNAENGAELRDDDNINTTKQRPNKLSSLQVKQLNVNEDAESLKPSTMAIFGGLELGSYLFIGNCCQVIGLKTVPADKAAFLVQLTTIMVPLFSAIFAGDVMSISLTTWIACLIAFSGVIIMGLDNASDEMSLSSDSSIWDLVNSSNGGGVPFTNGDALIMFAAVAYTMHVIRLGRYAKLTSPLKLSASKATVEAILSVCLIVFFVAVGGNEHLTNGASSSSSSSVEAFVRDTSSEILTYFRSFSSYLETASVTGNEDLKRAGLACLWTGWVTCAYTIYAQSFGQRRVEPTEANLIYTTQPVFSSLFAWILLGESLGNSGFIGGALIGVALWLVTKEEKGKS